MERVVMELIEKLTNELDAEIQRIWSEYADAHTKFAECCKDNIGKPIGDKAHEVNELLGIIQSKFGLLWPAYNFIATRHQSVSNAVSGYTEFIEIIKKSGGQQEDPNGPKIIEG